MLRKALAGAILAVSTPAYAAESNTAGFDGGDAMSVLAFAILFACLSRLAVPDKAR